MNDEPRLLGSRYRVGKLIGRGGMGDVYLGTDTRLGRTVAIKILRSQLTEDEGFRRRFRQEAQSAARMNHPNIVRTYDTGEDETVDGSGNPAIVPYIVMEYVEGKTVKDFIRSGALTQNDSVRIITDVLAALEYAHASGLVHRDIKPGNVMVSVSGFVKVMDFGVAKAVADSSATVAMSAHVMGTATYFSPEQAKGESVDSRSDLYSAGVMLYEMLTGQPPFHGDSPTAVAYQHVNTVPVAPTELNPEISARLSLVVLTALAKSKDARYTTARNFSDDLLYAVSGREPRNAHLLAATHPEAAPTEATASPAPSAIKELGFDALVESAPNTVATSAPKAESKTRKLLPWIAVIVLGLAAALSLIWFLNLGSSVAPTDNRVEIADLSGAEVGDARATLEALGLTVVTEEQESATVDANRVIETDPVAGSSVLKNTSVTVIVSTGPAEVSVPNLTGLSLETARTRITDLGLTVGEVSTEDDADYSEGTVISSTPKSSTSVDVGSSVALVVASGKIKISDVTGDSISDARKTLEDLGLSVNAQPLYICNGADGEVVKQSPRRGKVTTSTTVTLVYNLVDPTACESSPSSGANTD